MQVRRDNFPAVLPHFLELLQSCDFYAMDEEMTGINVPEVTESITFAPAETYHSKRLAASRYSIIQVGVCLFRRTPAQSGGPSQRYQAYPFNFLLFPQNADDYTAEERSDDVVVSPSALAFLRRHGMDFQRWVYEGMAFCDASRETALRARLVASNAGKGTASATATAAVTPLFTDAEKTWLDESRRTAEALLRRVEESWAKAAAEVRQRDPKRAPVLTSVTVEGGKDAVLPAQASRAAREELEVQLERDFPQLQVRSRRSGRSGHVITLTALSPEEVAKRSWKVAQKENRQLLDTIGFRAVFTELTKSKKPCVGHNCFADWLFLMTAMDGPLPAGLPQWKARARALFPLMWDTRYLATREDFFPRDRFGNVSLAGLYETYAGVSPHCAVELPLGFESYDPVALLGRGEHGQNPAHEAGYDALMTGTVFINLLAEAGFTLETAPPELCNKLALFRSLYAVDLQNDANDEYTPTEAGVLDLQHSATVKPYHIESCLAAQDVIDVSLYSVTDVRTLGVLRRSRQRGGGGDAGAHLTETVARRLNENCSHLLKASPYTPPHLRPAASTVPPSACSGSYGMTVFPPPTSGVEPVRAGGGVGGGLRRTMQRLMRCRPFTVPRLLHR